MKKVYGGLILLLLMVFVPLVSSYESELTIKVDEGDNLIVRVLEPNLEQDVVLGNQIEMTANSEGLARKIIKFDEPIVWFKIMIYEDSAVQSMKYFKKAYKMGEPVYIDFWEVQKNSSAVVSEVVASDVNLTNLEEVSSNESIEESDVSEVEEDSTQFDIAGGVVTDTKSGNSSMVEIWSNVKEKVVDVPYYISLGVLGLIAVFIFVLVVRKHIRGSGGNSSYDFGNSNRKIQAAEAQIKRAQEKIRKIQNKERIRALEQKIQEEKSSLNKVIGD